MTNYKTETNESWFSCFQNGRGDPTGRINTINRRTEEMLRPNQKTGLTCKQSVCQDFLFQTEIWKLKYDRWVSC